MAYNEDSSASGHDEPWIQWFCGLKGHEMFCEVERSYIEDGFNLYGLRGNVSNFSDCLDLILDRIGPDDSDDSHLTQNACTLYGLIHARYIITAHGLDAMYNKYAAKEFGTCPLVQCSGQPVLPVGLRDEMGADTVKIFCPKCQCVYHPPPVRSRSSHHGGAGAAGVDGAAFGTTFPHLFLMTFNNLVPDRLPQNSTYVPRVFGFRVHMSARQRASSTSATTAGSTRQRNDVSRNMNLTRRSNEANGRELQDRRSRDAVGNGNRAAPAPAAAGAPSTVVPAGQTGTTETQNVADAVQQATARNESQASRVMRAPAEGASVPKEEDGSKKSKAGKRRTDDSGSKKSDSNGAAQDGSSKRRRRDNGGNGPEAAK